MKKNVMGYTNAWTSQRDFIRDESPVAMCIYKRRRVGAAGWAIFSSYIQEAKYGDGSKSKNIKAKFKQYKTKMWIQSTMQVYYHSTSKMKTRSKLCSSSTVVHWNGIHGIFITKRNQNWRMHHKE